MIARVTGLNSCCIVDAASQVSHHGPRLKKEGLPLVRYRTRDRTILRKEKCACGRTMVRMEKVLGRTDDMLIIRGINVFPSQVEHVLLEIEELEPQYVIYVDREKDKLDTLEVWVEASPELYAQGEVAVGEMTARVKKAMQETLSRPSSRSSSRVLSNAAWARPSVWLIGGV